MTADSQLPVQAAMVTALRAASAVTSQLAGGAAGVLDDVEAGTPYPYISLGEATGRRWDTKTEDGMDQQVTVHIWSQYRGLKQAKEIMAAVVGALDGQGLTVTGHDLVEIRLEFSQVLLDPDGLTRHGVQRFRVLTEAS